LNRPVTPKEVTLIRGGTIVTSKTKKGLIENGWVMVRGGRITKIGEGDPQKLSSGDKVRTIEARGRLILPGFVNCHTHLYGTLARGILLGESTPRNFRERLETLWWRLDKALTYEDCYWSALVGSLLSLKAGVTTLFDHHSSPYSIDRSLDAVAAGMTEAGARGAVCYEVSDRDGQDRASLGIYENVRFAQAAKARRGGMIGSFMGLHASFTLSQPTLLRARDAAAGNDLGFHLHVAEDLCDLRDSQKRYRRRVVTRLSEAGILSHKTLAIHCVHVSDAEIVLLAKTGTNVINCPRSNLSNAVGVARLDRMFRHGVRLGFGSDGFGPDILDDAYDGLLSWRLNEKLPYAGWVETELMLLKNNPIIASSMLDVKLGDIVEGNTADILIASYDSPSPLTRENLWQHLLSRELRIETVLVGGRIVIRDGRSCTVDEDKVFDKAKALARDLWRRM
jgi:putative selenium metabolism protein SsnA